MLVCDWRVMNRAVYREFGIGLKEFAAQWQSTGKAEIRRVLFERAKEKTTGSDGMARYFDKKFLGGLPPEQLPAAPTVQVHAPTLIQNNAAPLQKADVVGLLAEILGKSLPAPEKEVGPE